MAVKPPAGVARTAVDAIASAPSHVGLDPVDHGVIFTRNTANAWESGLAEGPTIFRNTDGRWGMCYVGYDKALNDPDLDEAHPRIGLAWSNDLVNWKRDSNQPIFDGTGTPGDDDCTVTGPFMWVEDGVYTLIYIGCSEIGFEAGTKRLCVATSSDPTDPDGWTRHGAIISPTGASSGAGAWRGLAIWHPNVVKVGGTYHLFFNASGYGNIADERIGHASATSLTGPWTVDSAELLAKGSPGTWEATRVIDPCVYQVGDTWYMAYGGIEDNGAQTSRDGLAYTSATDFPYGWVKHPSNPILQPQYGSGGKGGARPFIVNTPAGHFHFFTAQGDGQNGIALAMQDANVDGPWHFIGGGGDNPLADPMDAAWFPAFAANWSHFDPTGENYPLAKYRVVAGGRSAQVTGLAKHATTLDLASPANTPFEIARHAWPSGVRGASALTFDAQANGDRAGNFRVNATGGLAYTVGPTAANSGYWLDTVYPL